jgi:hypothetical protein
MSSLRHVVAVAACVSAALVILLSPRESCAGRVLDAEVRHVRSGAEREWEEFPERAERDQLVVRFDAVPNAREQTLRLRQRDVKQDWRVRLNGRVLGALTQDEAEIVGYWAVPAGALREGENELRVAREGAASPADDVMLGDVELFDRPREEVLSSATLDVEVVDGDGGEGLPCRITVADPRGGLVTFGGVAGTRVAFRPGVVYTADGKARIRLPAGKYTVYAGRGFEYSLERAEVELAAGGEAKPRLSIRREVPTKGYVACDTHIHTATYARHGDATLDERMLTLAGEGVELPVATEHNLQIDYTAAAEKAGVRRYFTPVMGNEVTTGALGHFNVFPIPAGAKLIDWRPRDWAALRRSIASVAPEPVVVLNHGRDVHGGFRPLDPKRHSSVTGRPLDGREIPANAMEVINSGATRADWLELYRDWFGLLNGGRKLTPVGASDSHDVSRYIVGQGRTYVACPDEDAGKIDVEHARQSLLAGRVLVSYGLLTEMTVGGRFGPGELAAAEGGQLNVAVRVSGPGWVEAGRVALYANGVEIRSAEIEPKAGASPLKWEGNWALERPAHDVHLVAIASGPGVERPYWPAAKPYQPTSPRWESYVIGSTGAVWVDADGSGKFDSAADYAAKIVEQSGAAPDDLVRKLAAYDEAVAAQAAAILRERGDEPFRAFEQAVARGGAPATRRGVEAFGADLRASGGN